MKHYTYLLINILSVIVPFVFSFHPKLQFYKKWKAFWSACIVSAIIFISWDIYFARLGVWGFNPEYLTGVKFGGLPLEECLFFICIPYATVFTYHCLNLLIEKDYLRPYFKSVTYILIILLLVIGCINFQKLYTSVTFILCAILLIILIVKKSRWLSRFYFTYIITLIPFFIVNGILTGSFIDEPIVWYNNNENLNIRLLTIPVEDIFYGMLLLLLNVSLFEDLSDSIYSLSTRKLKS